MYKKNTKGSAVSGRNHVRRSWVSSAVTSDAEIIYIHPIKMKLRLATNDILTREHDVNSKIHAFVLSRRNTMKHKVTMFEVLRSVLLRQRERLKELRSSPYMPPPGWSDGRRRYGATYRIGGLRGDYGKNGSGRVRPKPLSSIQQPA